MTVAIVVVDDDKARFLLKKIHEVLRIRPEIIFIEIRLHGMSGIECMRRLKVTVPSLIIVMISELAPQAILAEAKAARVGILLTAKSGVHPIVRFGKTMDKMAFVGHLNGAL